MTEQAVEPNVFFDREVEHKVLLLALETIEETRGAVARHHDARATVKELTASWKAGERVKVGPFILEVKERSGGGYRIDEWRATSAVIAHVEEAR